MKKHLLFITEGVDDVAIISAIIEHLGIAKEKNHLKEIDAFWKDKLIPQKYPFKKDKLDRVSPVPNFYEAEQLSIAIKAANGEGNIFKELAIIFDIYKVEEIKQINGIFILCDADKMQANEKITYLLKRARENGDIESELNVDLQAGTISWNSINIPLVTFVYPNNCDSGDLEHLLLKIAQIKYPDLLKRAADYVEKAKENYGKSIGGHDRKAIVGCICNVLRPASANNISLKKDDWIEDTTIGELQELYDAINLFCVKCRLLSAR